MTADLVSPLMRWSVQAIIITKQVTIIGRKTKKIQSASKMQTKIVVYRTYFERLLQTPKSLRDQLIIELPTLMGMRCGEVIVLKREHVDFEHGDLYVLDSKKDKFSPIPLDLTVADHLDKFIQEKGIVSGYVFTRIHNAGRKGPRPAPPTLSTVTIEAVWEKWCERAGIPYMSPRYGRAYFAAKWHFVEHKSMFNLMAMLRHENILATQHYLDRIVDYSDLKAEFNQGKKTPFSAACRRMDSCPLAAPDCRCRMFTPNLEAEVHE